MLIKAQENWMHTHLELLKSSKEEPRAVVDILRIRLQMTESKQSSDSIKYPSDQGSIEVNKHLKRLSVKLRPNNSSRHSG